MSSLQDSLDIFFRLQGDHGVAAVLTFQNGTTVEMDWPSFDENPRYSGTSMWASNQALRSSLWDFAYRTKIGRTAYAKLHALEGDPIEEALAEADRDEKVIKKLRATADAAQEALENVARVLQYGTNESGEQRHAWCSACFKLSAHLKLDVPRFWERAFYCLACGILTIECATPSCEHSAVRGTSPRGRQRFCALHAGEIAAFEVLNDDIPDLADWKNLPQFSKRNSAPISRGGSTFSLANAVPGLIGNTASDHGVALLQGGAEAAGGLGIAGGKVVVTTFGVEASRLAGQRVANAYLRKDRSFDIEKIRDGNGVPVIYASGIFARNNDEQAWRQLIDSQYPHSPVYQLHWAAQPLKRVSRELAKSGDIPAMDKAQERLTKRATRQAERLFGPTAAVAWVLEAMDTAWHDSQTWAVQAGWTLANILSNTQFQYGFVLVGHSFGAAVMAEAALALSSGDPQKRPTAIHLLGAVLPAHAGVERLASAVKEKVFNYFSLNDDILRHLYPLANFGSQAAGLGGFQESAPAVEQVDCSGVVSGHHGYFGSIKLQRGS